MNSEVRAVALAALREYADLREIHFDGLPEALAEAQVARRALAELEREPVDVWLPLEDGVHDTQHEYNKVRVSGEWLTVREKNLRDPDNSFVAEVALPDDIRLCRRAPSPQPATDAAQDDNN